MKDILEKYSSCDMFSLTSNTDGINISDELFDKAINKLEKYIIENLKKLYNDEKDKLSKYPDFDKLYKEIEEECYAYIDEPNNNNLNIEINNEIFNKLGLDDITDVLKNRIKNNFEFHCTFIADNVGKTTKYGKEYSNIFYRFYHDIAFIIDCKNSKSKYSNNKGKDFIEVIPEELKDYLVKYEVSFYSSVTISSNLMIIYYFKLNDLTKKYLLQFKSDFDLVDLEDLVLYQNDKELFSSCTHERYNSLMN